MNGRPAPSTRAVVLRELGRLVVYVLAAVAVVVALHAMVAVFGAN